MDLVLHVGMFKTASTTLQVGVFPRLGDLHVVGRKNPGERQDSPLSMAMEQVWHEEYRPGELRRRLEERASGGRTLVSEEVWTSPVRHRTLENLSRTADRLAAELPEAAIVMVVRRPADLLVSCYAQYVMAGGTISWRRFLAGWDMRAFDVEAVARLYEERFSPVSVLAFEDLADPALFAGRLAGALGTGVAPEEIAGWLARTRQNPGFGPPVSFVQRFANRAVRVSHWNPTPVLASLDRLYPRLVYPALYRADRAMSAGRRRFSRRVTARRRAAAAAATARFSYPLRSTVHTPSAWN